MPGIAPAVGTRHVLGGLWEGGVVFDVRPGSHFMAEIASAVGAFSCSLL